MLVTTACTQPPRAFAAFASSSQRTSSCTGPATPARTIPGQTTPGPPPAPPPTTPSTITALPGPTPHLLDLPLLLQPLHELSLRVVAPQVARRRPPRVDADADHRNLVPHLPRPVRRQQRAEDDPRLERRVVLPAELSQQPQHQLVPLAKRHLADPPLALDLLDQRVELQLHRDAPSGRGAP